MKLQILQDNKGNDAGIFIPIKDWQKLKRQFRGLEAFEIKRSSKNILLNELKEALFELKLIEEGKLTARPAADLLNEL